MNLILLTYTAICLLQPTDHFKCDVVSVGCVQIYDSEEAVAVCDSSWTLLFITEYRATTTRRTLSFTQEVWVMDYG